MNADQLRNTFTKFFVDRGHLALPAASLVPNDPSMLFTIAGWFSSSPTSLVRSPPPGPRATTVQPCVRTVDIDVIGTTSRHVTFFEMLGNFSFGDYFKELAIAYAWELFTEILGLDPAQLWVTVHVSDDEAAALWRDVPGLSRVACSGSTRTTSGRWVRRVPAARVLRSSSTADRSTAPAVGPPKGANVMWSSGTWSSCSMSATTTGRSPSFLGGTSTPEPGSTASSRRFKASSRSSTPT